MNVLAIGCHPDDLEIGCFGTLARYVKEGHKVTACHITNGSLGHVSIPPEKLRLIRNKESEKAAAVIGADCVTLDISDLAVDSMNSELLGGLVEIIRNANPDIIIAHSEEDYMRDHLEAGLMAFGASFDATIVQHHRSIPATKSVVPLYYMDTLAGVNFIPTEYVDISDEIELKLEALSCHESQINWLKDHDGIDFVDFVRTCSKYRGLQSSVAYAEGFKQCLTWPRIVTRRMLP